MDVNDVDTNSKISLVHMEIFIIHRHNIQFCLSIYIGCTYITQNGSFYYSNNRTAYAMLNMIGKHEICAHVRKEFVSEEFVI